ncbi:orotidine 5'-phosphate decarboxylase [Candidatus Dependentiae bacterium]|nr:orotidine 5'-phosphate decarboxylase [Candidatus Dependentiae bacterium]
MKLQISFDLSDLEKAVAIAQEVADYAHIIEIGTILIHKYGAKSVEAFRQALPNKTLLADTKIADRGAESAAIFAQAGADWITVMAGTSNEVIHTACNAAHKANLKVMLDLIDGCSLGQSAMEAKNLGVNALLFHQPHDQQEVPVMLDRWEMVRGNTNLPIFISAKIKRENVQKILAFKPDGIIVGKAVCEADNPREEAQFFYDLVSKQ